MAGMTKAPTPESDEWTDEALVAKLRSLPGSGVGGTGIMAGYATMVLAREVRLLRVEMKGVREDIQRLVTSVRMR